jgi:hypothetical protein
MNTVKVIRYRTKPERSDENAELVRKVFAELAVDDPGGLRYVTLRLEDNVSFVHIAVLDGEVNPLASSEAFKQFQSEIAQRCEEGPTATDATIVGAYSFDIR